MDSQPHAKVFRFGVFEFDACRYELRKHGLKIRAAKKAAKLLSVLLESPGQVITRQQLAQKLFENSSSMADWDCALNKEICELRRVLGDSALSPRYVETIASKGYRFMPLPDSVSQRSLAPHRSRLTSIAVLPLGLRGGVEPELELLASQIVRQLIRNLSKLSRLRVLAYNVTKHYTFASVDPRSTGRELNVEGVVLGEALSQNGDMIIELELVDVADGTQILGLQVNHPFPLPFAGAEAIAVEIASQLRQVLMYGRKSIRSEMETPLTQDLLPVTLSLDLLKRAV
jgi:DNA-binding winged helix-turn-helix (wHTH) protein